MNILIKEFNKIKEFYKLGKDVQLKDALVLLKACKSFGYKKGELLLEQGTKDNNIYFITKGLVRCFNINEKEKKLLSNLLKNIIWLVIFILFYLMNLQSLTMKQ